MTWLLACSLIIFGAHTTLGLSDMSPIPSFVFLGLSYAIYGVVIWPSVATVAQHTEQELKNSGAQIKLLGTAFGISTSCLNTALTILPMVTASIRVHFGSFVYLEMFFASLALGGVGICIVLFVTDARMGGVLQGKSAIVVEEDDVTSNGTAYNRDI